MDIKIPTVEDKIYELLSLDIKPEQMSDEKFRKVIDEIMKSKGLSMEQFINMILLSVENGYSLEEQFDEFQKALKK